MKLQIISWIILICLLAASCTNERNEKMIERYKAEILNTEKAFARLVKDEGQKTAFLAYAAEDAVLQRGDKLIKGIKAIEEYFKDYKYRNVRLEWDPDFIDVSASGDLAYTYGHYDFEATDESGKIIKATGVFHTVWKRESNGEWRYVWD
jgi:ketosteroid isomerase-like protein